MEVSFIALTKHSMSQTLGFSLMVTKRHLPYDARELELMYHSLSSSVIFPRNCQGVDGRPISIQHLRYFASRFHPTHEFFFLSKCISDIG